MSGDSSQRISFNKNEVKTLEGHLFEVKESTKFVNIQLSLVRSGRGGGGQNIGQASSGNEHRHFFGGWEANQNDAEIGSYC